MAPLLAVPCPAASLFLDPTGTAFADLVIDGHRETWPIRGKQFRAWLRRRYYEETGGAPSAEAVSSAVDLLEARAQFDSPERTVHFRVAEHDGHIYLDHADKHWRAVEIGPDGWCIIAFPPVRFRRAAGMLALSLPERGGAGSVSDLVRLGADTANDGSWRNAGWVKNPPGAPADFAGRRRPSAHWALG